MKFDLIKPTIIDGEQRRNELLKISIFSILIINIFSVLLFSILDFRKFYVFIIVSIGFLNIYFTSLLLFKRKKITVSKITIITAAPIQAMIGAIFFFGSDSFIQAYFVLYGILSLMLWSLEERKYSFPLFFLNLACFIIVEFVDLEQFHTIDLNKEFITYFALINVVASFIIFGAFIIWYQFATSIYEDKIKYHRTELIKKNETLISQNDIINNTNKKLAERQEQIEEQSKELITQKEELIKINDRLHELVATKDKFFSIIAHDLKNPLGNIIGFSNVLLRDISDFSIEKLQNMAKIINDSSKRTYNLLENLLIWSKVQMNGINTKIEPLRLHKLVDDCYINLNNMALKKSITIQNEVDKNLKIESDRYMLSLIINNLLTNAIKFTHQNGFVKISCETQNDNIIQVCISDTGVGISEKVINNLFKIEKNISTEGTNQEKGTGLGLLLCKEFIDVLGGRIWVESSEGKGSKFYFTIKQ